MNVRIIIIVIFILINPHAQSFVDPIIGHDRSWKLVNLAPLFLNKKSIDPTCEDKVKHFVVNRCGIGLIQYNACSPLYRSALEANGNSLGGRFRTLKCKNIKFFADNYGISIESLGIFFEYTGSAYIRINKSLRTSRKRDGQINERLNKERLRLKSLLKPLINQVNLTLEKLPYYIGRVHRILKIPDEIKHQYKVGNTVTLEGFSSASLNRRFTMHAASPDFDKLIIESKTGHYIGQLSLYPNEFEILLKHGVKYKVTKIKKDKIFSNDNKGSYKLQSQYFLEEVVDFDDWRNQKKNVDDIDLMLAENTREVKSVLGACNTVYRINEKNDLVKEFKRSTIFKQMIDRLSITKGNCLSCALQESEFIKSNNCNEYLINKKDGLQLGHQILLSLWLEDMEELNSDHWLRKIKLVPPNNLSLIDAVIPEKPYYMRGNIMRYTGYSYQHLLMAKTNKTSGTKQRWTKVLKERLKYLKHFLPYYTGAVNLKIPYSSEYRRLLMDLVGRKYRMETVGDVLAEKTYLMNQNEQAKYGEILLHIRPLKALNLFPLEETFFGNESIRNKVVIRNQAKMKVLKGNCNENSCEFLLEEVLY